MYKLTLTEVMQCLREEFTSEKWSRDAVRDILQRYDETLGEWKKYCKFDDHGYYRVVIDTGNDRYNLVILCWNYGQGTPVHDHPAAECMFKVCEGTISETRYRYPEAEQALEAECVKVLEQGQVGHINDDQGIHRMENESDTDTCVTLHCYFPPYKSVNLFDERSGRVTNLTVTPVLSSDIQDN